MSTYPSIDTAEMELTPAIVKFKKPGDSIATDLGGTLGNIKVKVQYKKAPIKADQFGDTLLNQKVSGFMATVETELTQIKDWTQVKVIFPHSTLVQPTLTATITIASPGVITTSTAHNYAAGDTVVFSTTGSLPTGIVAGTTYYVISTGLTATDFEISATSGGPAINTTGTQSGTHSVTGGHLYALQFNTNVGDDDVSNAGELTLHPQSETSSAVGHDWVFPLACASAESEITYSPTEQARMKIIWNIYPDTSVTPARFLTYGDVSF